MLVLTLFGYITFLIWENKHKMKLAKIILFTFFCPNILWVNFTKLNSQISTKTFYVIHFPSHLNTNTVYFVQRYKKQAPHTYK